MSLSTDEVKKIAHLARIKMSDAEVEKSRNELNKILAWIEQLQEVNTDGIEPMTTAEDMNLPMREDRVGGMHDNSSQQAVLKNAPNAKYNYFAVNKVVE
jgi:aspartyl-tRNA(Asn)/glutamyl-tRNA(Gln) amidotransferase subunit C